MIGPALITLILVSAYGDDGPDAAQWIDRLGAEAFDERVAAYKAIERLGPSALPALNAATEARDPRVRSRVRALIATISRQAEANRLSRPIMIRLDFQERPLGEVIDALNDRYDLGLSLRLGPEMAGRMGFFPGQPDQLKALRDRVVTLEAAEAVPYWETIDRLCQVAALRYDVSPRPGLGTNQGTLALIADRTGRGPVSDSGPFRVQIAEVQTLFERDFLREPDGERKQADTQDGGDLTIALAVLAEPGLVLHVNGPVAVAEAVDDQERSLVLPAQAPPAAPNASYQVAPRQNALLHVNAKLLAPDPPGEVIRRLRGKIPVVAVTKRADPIIVRLKEVGAERLIETPDMMLIIDEVSLAPGTRASVRVTIRPKRMDSFGGTNSGRRAPNFAAFNRDRVLERFELRDAAGRKLNLSTSGQTRGADGQGFYDRYQLVVTPAGPNGPAGPAPAANGPIPSELRYYEQVQTTMEIAFDFQDIPMP